MKYITVSIVALVMAISNMGSTLAQISVENNKPTEFLNTRIYPLKEAANGVKVQKVSYLNRFQINVVGNLFLPPKYDQSKKYPAIVVGHPFGGVKEQTSGLHAQKLS